MPVLNAKQLGLFGVNVDKNPLELGDNELQQAQNAIHEPLGNDAGLVNRPGLAAFNTIDITIGQTSEIIVIGGSVLGGMLVPALQPLLGDGVSDPDPDGPGDGDTHVIFIGRSPLSAEAPI